MNKRLPILLSLIGMILLAASLAYWILQLYQPPQRPIAAAPRSSLPDPPVDAAAMLFGGQPAAATATNYQLTGVVAAGHDSVAIIVAEGAPPKALKVGHELTPGVKLAEVHPRYVMLSDGGVMKRIDLAQDAKGAVPLNGGGAPAGPQAGAPPVGAQVGAPVGGMPNMQPGTQLPAQPTPPSQAGNNPEQNATPEPPMSPGAVTPAPAPAPSEPPPANPNSTPAQPPARTTGAPVQQNPTAQ